MTKLIILTVFIILKSGVFSQDDIPIVKNFNEIQGALEITENNRYKIQFTGDSKKNELGTYSSLIDYKNKNCVWLKYTAKEEGELEFSLKGGNEIQFVIFQTYENAYEEITSGLAEIKRMNKTNGFDSIGLSKTSLRGYLYSLHAKKGETFYINIGTEKGEKDYFELDWKFRYLMEIPPITKIMDRRCDDFATTFSIEIFDQATNTPLVSQIRILGSKNNDASYLASTLLLNMKYTSEINIHIYKEGYIFIDTLLKVSSIYNEKFTCLLHRIEPGKSIRLNRIHFEEGTDKIKEESYHHLHKLREFLALNALVNIEIHGHVTYQGKNTILAQKLSENRADRVKEFLVENGINKNRLITRGFGNSKPINVSPKTSSEHQENRRVEVHIM